MKDVSTQQVVQHLKRLNPWWEAGSMDDETSAMQPRAFLQPVKQLMLESTLRRAVVLLGPRRVGKTILIRHLISSLLDSGINPRQLAYVEMDHPLLYGQSLDTLLGHIETVVPRTEESRYLFFDEIQSLKDWEKYLKPLVDRRPELRVLVSGSAAAALKRKSTESGAGRFTDFLLPPLTFSEYIDLRQDEQHIYENEPNSYLLRDIHGLNNQFIDYVNFGGYPELALLPIVRENPARFVKSDIIDKVLLRDLPQLYGISDIQELNSLFTILAFNTAEEVSFEELSKRSGVVKQTIQKYIEYLEAAFLIKRVFRVDQDGRRYQRARNFKVYLTNSAMYTGLFDVLKPDDARFGQLVETALIAQRFQQSMHLNFARWGRSDYEVDLVESSNLLKPVSALEIKWSDKFANNPKALKGLIKFSNLNKLPVVVASTRTKFANATIGNIDIRQYPAAVLAFHFGINAVRGRHADFHANVNDPSGE